MKYNRYKGKPAYYRVGRLENGFKRYSPWGEKEHVKKMAQLISKTCPSLTVWISVSPLLPTAETGATYEIWERMTDFERLHVKLKPGIDQKAAFAGLKTIVVHPENYFLMERRNGKYKEVTE